MITLSINVKKLDKLRFIEGEKGTYCNLILIETPNSEYGDYMVKQDMTKEERESGKDSPILGNAKIRGGKQQKPALAPPPPRSSYPDPDDEPLPF
jgi:hypothetical protein